MKQSSKVSPSSPNEKLKKARDLWTSSIPELPVTEVDPTIWERAQGFLPHGQWLVIFYRFFLFSMMIAFVYAKMDYQRNYEAAQLFDHYFPEEDFDSVKTQGDFFHWLDRVSKTAFEDSMGNYNGHDIGLHMHHFDYLTFAIQVSQIREDFMPLCKDPFIKKNTGRANIQKMLKFFGYNCSKDYRGIPGHPRFFYRPDEALEKVRRIGQSCPAYLKLNLTGGTDPFVVTKDHYEGDSPLETERYAFTIDSYDPGAARIEHENLVGPAKPLISAIKRCHWLDLKTRKIEVFVIYGCPATYAYGMGTFSFEFSPHGIVKKRSRTQNVIKAYYDMEHRDMLSELTADLTYAALSAYFLLFMLLLEFLVTCSSQISWMLCGRDRKNCLKRSTRIEKTFGARLGAALKENHSSMWWWILVRVPALLLFLKAFILDYGEEVHDLIQVDHIIKDMIEMKTTLETPREFRRLLFETFFANSRFQSTMIFVVFFSCISLFEPFMKIPAFSVVPRSLIKAFPDSVYLIIVLCSLLIAFATIFSLKYGMTIKRWSNQGDGIVTTYFMALGDISDPFNEVFSREPLFAFFAFGAFSLIVSITILNIFLSVVLDAYAQVKDKIAEESKRPSMKDRLRKFQPMLREMAKERER
jgi:hypothetical protein